MSILPAQEIEVEGEIITNQGGVRFPDNSLQTTAFIPNDPNGNSNPHYLYFLEGIGFDGDTNNPFHPNAIEITDYNFSLTGGSSQCSNFVFSITKKLDSQSLRFKELAFDQTFLGDVSLSVVDINAPESDIYIISFLFMQVDIVNQFVSNGQIYESILFKNSGNVMLSYMSDSGFITEIIECDAN